MITIPTPEFLRAEIFMRDEEVPASSWPRISPSQVHEDKILIINEENVNEFAEPEHPEADGVFLKIHNVEATLRFADCAPVLIWGKDSAMILHSGFKGTTLNIAAKGVELFDETPETLHAWIGPAIGLKNYVRNLYEDKWTLKGLFAFKGKNFQVSKEEGKAYFGIAGQIKWQLKKSGLAEKNIISSGVDTFENPECYSYRRGDLTERMTLKINLLPN